MFPLTVNPHDRYDFDGGRYQDRNSRCVSVEQVEYVLSTPCDASEPDYETSRAEDEGGQSFVSAETWEIVRNDGDCRLHQGELERSGVFHQTP